MVTLKVHSIPPSLKGSSLIEVTVAMLLTMLSFGLALMVVVQLFRTSAFEQDFKAQQLVHQWAQQSIRQQAWLDEEQTINQIQLSRQWLPHPQHPRLRILQVKAQSPDGRLLAQSQQIIYLPAQ